MYKHDQHKPLSQLAPHSCDNFFFRKYFFRPVVEVLSLSRKQYGWSRHLGWKLRSSRAYIGGEKKIVQRCKGGKTGLPIVLGWYNGLVRQDASSYDMKILVQHSFGVLRVRAKSHNTRTACRAIIFHRVSRSKYRSSTVFFPDRDATILSHLDRTISGTTATTSRTTGKISSRKPL